MRAWTPNQHQIKYAVLLTLLVVMILLPGTSARREIFNLCLVLVLGACVVAVGRNRGRLRAAMMISMLPIVSVLLPNETPGQTMAHLACQTAFLVYTITMILSDVFKAKDVNQDKLLGSVCAYFLVGLAFAMLYIAVAIGSPGSFRDSHGPIRIPHDRVSDAMDTFGYFSMITMSTVGYGDISPVSAQARSLTVLQAVFGQFYFALMVGRLMALYLRDLAPPDPLPSPGLATSSEQNPTA